MIKATGTVDGKPVKLILAHTCECSHDLYSHGVNLHELTAELYMAACFKEDCRCRKFKFKVNPV